VRQTSGLAPARAEPGAEFLDLSGLTGPERREVATGPGGQRSADWPCSVTRQERSVRW
jgi:hypothetical protein